MFCGDDIVIRDGSAARKRCGPDIFEDMFAASSFHHAIASWVIINVGESRCSSIRTSWSPMLHCSRDRTSSTDPGELSMYRDFTQEFKVTTWTLIVP